MIKDNITLWVTVYFVSKFGIDLQGSAYFVLLVPVVGLFGRLLHPVCYQLCGEREHRLSIYAFLICAAAAIPLCFDPILPVAAAVCLGLIYAAVSIINTSLLSVFPVRFQATGNIASVSGVMDFAAYLGAGIGSLVYGVTIEHIRLSADVCVLGGHLPYIHPFSLSSESSDPGRSENRNGSLSTVPFSGKAVAFRCFIWYYIVL